MARSADIAVRMTNGGQVLDLSAYHSLEHSLLSCPDKGEHVRLWWLYFGEEWVHGLIVGVPSRWLLCPVGKHWMLPTLDLNEHAYGSVCGWCEVRE